MAGRPKRRAALEAAGKPPDEPTDIGSEVARMLGVDIMPTGRAEVAQTIQREDRQSLAVWWREQFTALEEEQAARAADLANAGNHPSPAYAAQVRKFGALGMPPDVVAMLLGITEGIIAQFYENDWRVGEGMLVSQVAANLFRIASSGNDRVATKAAAEILNRRGGEHWRPPAQKLEIDDGRKTKQRVIDSSKLTFEQREQLRAIISEHMGQAAIEAPQKKTGLAADAEDADIIE